MTVPGWIIPLPVLLPNLIFLLAPPVDGQAAPPGPGQRRSRDRILEICERLGQAGCFLIPIFYRLDLGLPWAALLLAVMGLCLALYVTGWVRYLRRGRRSLLLFSPLLGLPLPMAVAPVVYFLAAGAALRSWPVMAAAVFLAAGHLYVSGRSYNALRTAGNAASAA